MKKLIKMPVKKSSKLMSSKDAHKKAISMVLSALTTPRGKAKLYK